MPRKLLKELTHKDIFEIFIMVLIIHSSFEIFTQTEEHNLIFLNETGLQVEGKFWDITIGSIQSIIFASIFFFIAWRVVWVQIPETTVYWFFILHKKSTSHLILLTIYVVFLMVVLRFRVFWLLFVSLFIFLCFMGIIQITMKKEHLKSLKKLPYLEWNARQKKTKNTNKALNIILLLLICIFLYILVIFDLIFS